MAFSSRNMILIGRTENNLVILKRTLKTNCLITERKFHEILYEEVDSGLIVF